MDKLQYVVDLMHRDFGCSTNSADYATESVLLSREELDTNLLPDFFDEINNEKEVLVHYYAVDEYMVYIITDATNRKWKLLGVLKDNKLTFHRAFV